MGANPTATGTLAQRYGGSAVNYSALNGAGSMSPHDALVARTKALYPFINNTNPVLIPSTKQGGEGWPIGEAGDPSYPRPSSIPINRPGVEVGPGSSEADVAGEVLHVDPYANGIREQLRRSLSPNQIQYLKKEALDYGTDADGMSEDDRIRNAVDSAIRGTVVNQWPAKANDGMNYTAQQRQLLNDLQQYMITGQPPTPQSLSESPLSPPLQVPSGDQFVTGRLAKRNN